MRTPRTLLMLVTLARTCGMAGGMAACSSDAPATDGTLASADEVTQAFCAPKPGCAPHYTTEADCESAMAGTFTVPSDTPAVVVEACVDDLIGRPLCSTDVPDSCTQFTHPDGVPAREATELIADVYCGVQTGCTPGYTGWAACMSGALYSLSGEPATVPQATVDACETALTEHACGEALPDACSVFVRH